MPIMFKAELNEEEKKDTQLLNIIPNGGENDEQLEEISEIEGLQGLAQSDININAIGEKEESNSGIANQKVSPGNKKEPTDEEEDEILSMLFEDDKGGARNKKEPTDEEEDEILSMLFEDDKGGARNRKELTDEEEDEILSMLFEDDKEFADVGKSVEDAKESTDQDDVIDSLSKEKSVKQDDITDSLSKEESVEQDDITDTLSEADNEAEINEQELLSTENSDYLATTAIFGGTMMIEILMQRVMAGKYEKETEIKLMLNSMDRINKLLNTDVNKDNYKTELIKIQENYEMLIAMCEIIINDFTAKNKHTKRIPKKVYIARDVMDSSECEKDLIVSLSNSIAKSKDSMTWKDLFSKGGKEELAKRKAAQQVLSKNKEEKEIAAEQNKEQKDKPEMTEKNLSKVVVGGEQKVEGHIVAEVSNEDNAVDNNDSETAIDENNEEAAIDENNEEVAIDENNEEVAIDENIKNVEESENNVLDIELGAGNTIKGIGENGNTVEGKAVEGQHLKVTSGEEAKEDKSVEGKLLENQEVLVHNDEAAKIDALTLEGDFDQENNEENKNSDEEEGRNPFINSDKRLRYDTFGAKEAIDRLIAKCNSEDDQKHATKFARLFEVYTQIEGQNQEGSLADTEKQMLAEMETMKGIKEADQIVEAIKFVSNGRNKRLKEHKL